MDASQLRYVEFVPPLPLSQWVRCIWHLTAPAGMQHAAEPIVPDGCVEMVLNFSDPFVRHPVDGRSHVQPLRLVAGQITRAISIEATGRVDLWGVRLHPWSTGAFFGVSAVELTDTLVELGAAAAALERGLERMFDVSSDTERRAALVEALTRHVSRLPALIEAEAGIVSLASGARKERDEEISVAAVARFAGVSTRRVQMLFREGVGLTPKRFMRITRFQRALGIKRENASVSWGAVAARAGYHDQAHLYHDSREIAGCTPVAVIGREAGLTEVFLTDAADDGRASRPGE